jgi:hypothetical protein
MLLRASGAFALLLLPIAARGSNVVVLEFPDVTRQGTGSAIREQVVEALSSNESLHVVTLKGSSKQARKSAGAINFKAALSYSLVSRGGATTSLFASVDYDTLWNSFTGNGVIASNGGSATETYVGAQLGLRVAY